MTDPRVNLRNPVIAAILAYLLPGAGHLYQRRFFKAAIYFVCVLGVFFWGCSLGEAKAVHLRMDKTARQGQTRQRTLGYLAQVGDRLEERFTLTNELKPTSVAGMARQICPDFRR